MGLGAFVTGLSQISSFFSILIKCQESKLLQNVSNMNDLPSCLSRLETFPKRYCLGINKKIKQNKQKKDIKESRRVVSVCFCFYQLMATIILVIIMALVECAN